MNTVENVFIHCPYCGESIELVIDCSLIQQEYIEDCEVCCRPISITLEIGHDGSILVKPQNENEC